MTCVDSLPLNHYFKGQGHRSYSKSNRPQKTFKGFKNCFDLYFTDEVTVEMNFGGEVCNYDYEGIFCSSSVQPKGQVHMFKVILKSVENSVLACIQDASTSWIFFFYNDG